MNEAHLAVAREAHAKHGRLSAPYLQRKLKISYIKAVEIIAIVTKELIK
jgi:DNA segregation ATPase FtsK/SpoIIIE-like protein